MDTAPRPTRIRRLSRQEANQIAAGEVIERPASVVKELVENSIDAGARHIEISISQAGSQRICVRDDGSGILPDDLVLALSRHATSKLDSSERLMAIDSLGFRGEALASIGAVARVTLTSRVADADDDTAWSVCCNESVVDAPRPASHPPGTTVEVEALFHNLPARRKFLRTERTEFMHIEQVVRALALSHFDVAFELLHNQRQVIREAVASDARARERRVARLCGRSFIEHARQLDFEARQLRLRGWVSTPDFTRSQSDLQYFFVNGRLIRDRLVNHAVRQAYHEQLPEGRFPACVLHLVLPPGEVDVNVHPTKHEVRFQEGRLVHDFVTHCVMQALAASDVATPFSAGETDDTAVAETVPGYGATLPPTQEDWAEDETPPPADSAADMPVPDGASEPVPGRVLGQWRAGYILLELENGLGVLDIAAAKALLAERHLQEAIGRGKVHSQPLLIPLSLELPIADVDRLDGAGAWTRALGLDMDRTGEHSVVIRRIPAALGEVDVRSLLQALVAEITAAGDQPVALAERIPALVAGCTFHIEGQMSRDEMETLATAVFRAGLAGDGRRVLAVISDEEVARRFQRQEK
ncbi:MAG TPA: DNA mismatch repair endonuclease MutL [Gammaproteobacteria bacterium]|nr:DNA mismatch repair endonuclease MutL [Gammaproteobacteria bacterium]